MQPVPALVRNYEIGVEMTLDLSSPRFEAFLLMPRAGLKSPSVSRRDAQINPHGHQFGSLGGVGCLLKRPIWPSQSILVDLQKSMR